MIDLVFHDTRYENGKFGDMTDSEYMAMWSHFVRQGYQVIERKVDNEIWETFIRVKTPEEVLFIQLAFMF